MQYNLIQPMAFRFTMSARDWPVERRQLYAMRFPAEWRNALAPLATRTPRGSERTFDSLPIRDLNDALRALLPDLVTITPGHGVRGAVAPWLLSRQPVDVRAIRRVVIAWAQSAAFSGASEERRIEAAKLLRPDALSWEVSDLANASWSTVDTVNPGSSASELIDPFRMLPELLAAHLTTSDRTFQFGADRRALRRALLNGNSSGVELVSWPPIWRQQDKDSWPFSFVITLTVQTVPFEPAPLLYADVSMRRWVTDALFEDAARVYLVSEAPWVEDGIASPYFGTAQMRRVRNPENRQWEWAWASKLPAILERIKLLSVNARPFPDPASIAERPAAALECLPGELAGGGAGVVYHTRMYKPHGLGAGFNPVDRATLIADQLTEALAPYCTLVAPLPRVHVKSQPLNMPASSPNKQAVAEAAEVRASGETSPVAARSHADNIFLPLGASDGLSAERSSADDDAIDIETDDELGDEADSLESIVVAVPSAVNRAGAESMAIPAGSPSRQDTLPDEVTAMAVAQNLGLRPLTAEGQRNWRIAHGRASNGQTSVIMLACQTGMAQAALITALRCCLGMETTHQTTATNGSGADGELRTGVLRWETPEGRIEVILRTLGPLGEALALSRRGARREQRLVAIEERARIVQDIVARDGFAVPMRRGVIGWMPRGAIVELQAKEQFLKDQDPKPALRLGLARAGALSQFIQPPTSANDDSLGHRAVAAVADLFRQLGAQTRLPGVTLRRRTLNGWSGITPPASLRYLAFWFIRKQAKTAIAGRPIRIPVCVLMEAQTHTILAYAPGFEHPLPYGEALVRLACDLSDTSSRVSLQREEVAKRFIEDVMRQWPGENTLVLAPAQNLRNVWPWLANTRLAKDRIAWGGGASTDIRDMPGMRIVRVRDASGHETPEWYAIAPDAVKDAGADARLVGFSKGLWQLSGVSQPGGANSAVETARVFASTAGRPSTQRGVSVKQSRMAAGDQGFAATNPQLIELTVAALQPGDTALDWAAYTHALRQAASHWGVQVGDALKLPLPLHLARLMEEYALEIGEEDEDENEDDGSSANEPN